MAGMIERWKILAAAALACLVFIGPGSAGETPEATARAVEQKLRTVSSIQADFEQFHFSMSVSVPMHGKGRFYFQKPDLMRWEYDEPEKQVFLYADGVFQFYIPDENRLIRSRVSRERFESEILALFSGTRRFAETYRIEAAGFPTENRAADQIMLNPLEEDGELAYILLETDRKTRNILKAVLFDWAGTKQEFRFRRIRTGQRFPAGTFILDVPPGTEILDDDDIIRGASKPFAGKTV
jgi:outer membrane lipoprotein carrier protein